MKVAGFGITFCSSCHSQWNNVQNVCSNTASDVTEGGQGTTATQYSDYTNPNAKAGASDASGPVFRRTAGHTGRAKLISGINPDIYTTKRFTVQRVVGLGLPVSPDTHTHTHSRLLSTQRTDDNNIWMHTTSPQPNFFQLRLAEQYFRLIFGSAGLRGQDKMWLNYGWLHNLQLKYG